MARFPGCRPALGVFAVLLASYAAFWHARDWNGASRLMLTYALGDRGTLAIDGLEHQTGDLARFRGHYYTDKLPGFSLLALPPYRLAKAVFRWPDHPRNGPGLPYWEADYGVTLATSGLWSAWAGALLAVLARDLGCGPRRSALVGLAYGLATPAYVYATLPSGHQVTASALLTAFALLWRTGAGRPRLGAFGAGLLAALAAVVELQVGPVAALLGLWLIVKASRREVPAAAVATFGLGAALPTAVLLAYNVAAFGSPWEMGYFHEVQEQFARVHSAANPLGLQGPDVGRVADLLWRPRRGLLWFAPIVVLAPAGWVALAWRRSWGVAVVSLGACAAIFVVNLCYPNWTGGMSTGPRLLVPLLPFAMLPVAAWIARGGRVKVSAAIALAVLGGVVMLLYQGAGARIPDGLANPLIEGVWPLWRGDPLPGWAYGRRFARNVVAWTWPAAVDDLPASWGWLQFAPIASAQAVAIAGLVAGCRAGRPSPVTPPRG